ncbi:sulfite exporter TauE/SafE family protein [Alteromonas gilva]|uniref:Probable membrane transporter protein n=1 Tax=Alteromonas gilva TaxID=2987522 RepID=A0ABT5L852_9ALTE|nr:sulfite exporter TauE/SafE family protein [Alteromonas gilva]MDC8833087.1 sulfite exporter TauE/SafE family protein [Alteromonas gilva]
MEPLLVIFLSCMALGMLTGTLAGMLGIGGGLIIVPVLTLLLSGIGGIGAELAMPMAIATSLFTIIVTGFFSAKAHYSLGNIVPKLIIWCCAGIAVGAVAGAQLASVLPAQTLARVFAVLVILIALQMVFGRKTASKHHYTPTILVVVGVIVGTVSALMGIGGGALLVPALVWFQVPLRQAIGCAAVSGLVIAMFGTGSFIYAGWGLPTLPPWSLGYVFLPAGLGIMATSVFTAGFGARLGQNMPTALLKNILAGLLVIVSIRMIIGME